MASYEVTVPEGVPADVEVRCTDHGTSETFARHRSTLPFHCPECEVELAIDIRDTADWRELTERC
jgi:hypothetical protein